MKHWKAYIKYVTDTGDTRQYIATVAALNELEAINAFRQTYGPACIIGWVQETKLYGLQSAGY